MSRRPRKARQGNDGGRPLPGGSWPLDKAGHLEEHLLWMRAMGRTEQTLFARRRAVVRLAEHLGHDPAAATFTQLERWQLELASTRSVAVLKHQTALIRPYYRWLHQRGLRGDDPAALLGMPRLPKGLPRPIAEDRLTMALEQAPPRLLPWLLLAGFAGLRAGEIARLRRTDFYTDPHGTVWLRVSGKGGHLRHVPIASWVWPQVDAAMAPEGLAWRRERGSGPVTPEHVSHLCNLFLHRIGIPDTLHSLRHRAATLTYESSGDLRLVQDLLGHSTPATTAIYTRVAPQRIAAAVEALPPPGTVTGLGSRRRQQTGD